MSEIVRITTCQLDSRATHRAAALAALARHVAEQRPDVLVLPEMPFSAWLAADREVDAARWRESVAAHDAAIKALVELGAPAIVASRPTAGRRNEAFTWEPVNGAVGVREKYYLPDEPGYWEASWYDRGERRFDTARVGPATTGILLCSELWFLEWARHYARTGVELLCVPRATPHGTLPKWLAAGQVAAVCSGAYCVSANQWVPGGGEVEAGGLGWVIGPDGEILATTSDEEPFVTVEVDLAPARAAKRTYPRYVRE